jgi:outer membrane protein TolC
VTIITLLSVHSTFADQPSASSNAPSQVKLPDPLSLRFALELDVGEHPQLQRAQADVERKQAEKLRAGSYDDFTAGLQLEARQIDPSPLAPDQDENDSQAHLYLRKPLYDFGRSSAADEAAAADLQGSQWLYTDAVNQRKIVIMSRFFEVLLADLTYARDNEAMSIGYVRFDRGRTRNKLGQLSDVKLLELQNTYQRLRRNYYQSQAEQRNARSRLANALNRPGELVSNLITPDLQVPLDKLPDVSELQQQAIDNNPLIKAMRLQVAAAQQRIRQARSDRYPTLNGQVQISEYARQGGSYDDWRASIVLDVPLITGDSVDAQVGQRTAQLREATASLRQAQMAVGQQVLEAWQTMQSLKVGREQTSVQQEFRELELDRNRTLYQMEVQSDLGDAMVNITDARLQKARVEYDLAIQWAKIQALTGQTIKILQEQSDDTAQ